MSPLPPPFTPELKVLVLAGANRVPGYLGNRPGPDHPPEVPLEAKAFLQLRGRLVIEYVLDWLAESGLRHVWVLAPPPCLDLIPSGYAFHPLPQAEAASLAQNLQAARDAVSLERDEPALAVFGDHPLTTSTALHDFLAFCGPRLEETDFFHGVALHESYAAFAPFFRRTSVFMRELAGRATGLNLVMPHRIHRMPAFDHIYSVRKLERIGRFVSLLAREMVLLGGSAPHCVLDSVRMYLAKECEKLSRREGRLGGFGRWGQGWLQRQVPASRLERYAARLLGAERGVRVVPLAHGGTAIDVDFAEELAVLEDNWDTLVAITRRQDAVRHAGAGVVDGDATDDVAAYASGR